MEFYLHNAISYIATKRCFARLSIHEKLFTSPTIEHWEFAKKVCERLKVFFSETKM
jgi:hypothetical protein